MMSGLPLITNEEKKYAEEHLDKIYKKGFIPPEKKTWLVDLFHSTGPYLAVESAKGSPRYLLDAASQITSLGLGFNPSAFFFPSHHLEAWTNLDSEKIEQIRQSFQHFLARKLQAPRIHTTLCHSGAEANEIALGYCYQKRINPDAKKVLAFRGSFHGRMLVSLFSSWNPAKREPFQWPGYETVYVDHPSLPDDQIIKDIPSDWFTKWDDSGHEKFSPPEKWSKDEQMKKEVASLMEIRKKLSSGEIYALIIEPMQCEGGDNYSSNRFHGGLLSMAKSFSVPVIYDEVQTGFHLGNEFFWHTQFNLPVRPDFITCAKRAQVGMVISFSPQDKGKEEFNICSFLRGVAHANCLDQCQDIIPSLSRQSGDLLKKLVDSHSQHLESPRSLGTAFSFDLKDKKMMDKMVSSRFEFGMLFYPAGDKTLRFRLNYAYSKEDVIFLFERLEAMAQKVFHDKTPQLSSSTPPKKDNQYIYRWQKLLLANKFSLINKEKIDFKEQLARVKKLCVKEIFVIDKKIFSKYKQKIQALQKRIYEPARQTDIEKFQSAAEDPAAVCIGMKDGDDLIGIAFSSPLSNHAFERGVRRDPLFGDPLCLYSLDLTVDKKYQGLGLGRQLKYALSALAQAKGHRHIQGRNRDRLAAGMFTINLSLGAFEQFHLPWDYLDNQKFCDAIYYNCPITFSSLPVNLSRGVHSPLETSELTPEIIEKKLPYMVNKTTLSNFIDRCFLETLEKVFNHFPRSLQHGYTASGQSEAVDKIVKSLWFKGNHNTLSISFSGHFFGKGGFYARSLSGAQSYFPVRHLPHPNDKNAKEVLNSLEELLKKQKALGVWIEPLPQKTMERVSENFLSQLKNLCRQYRVALVYNETASSMYRYGKNIYCGSDTSLTPDAMMVYQGGQSAMVGVGRDFFVDKPLTMISTWDGDQSSLLNHLISMESIEKDPALYFNIRKKFHKKIIQDLQNFPVKINMREGMGFIEGVLPHRYRKMFEKIENRHLVCPSYGAMRRFLDE
ncbi:MAG: aminotransferase class III-fold pyridoxal phosphate-dependent enzyme [Halobacteriovoraceae bacterium]|nr:aminotransferase class III-fold pyridoxal phosphate-dependent enzyme [Halobacteriovoraceae bacterium]